MIFNRPLSRYLRSLLGTVLLVLGSLVTVGCSGQKSASSVSGTVHYNGQPLKQGEVNFYSKERGIGAIAKIDSSGKFTFPTPLERGTYQVSVMPPAPEPGPNGPKKTESEIPTRYAEPSTSGLSVTVASGKNVFPIELKD